MQLPSVSSVSIFQRVAEHIITTITISSHNSRTPGTSLWPWERENSAVNTSVETWFIFDTLIIKVCIMHGTDIRRYPNTCVHIWRKRSVLKKKNRFVTTLDLIKCLKEIKKKILLHRGAQYLSYHGIMYVWTRSTKIGRGKKKEKSEII